MLAATAAERRFGPAGGGWIGAAPSTSVVALLVVGTDLGRHAAATLAASTAARVGAQVAFAVAFASVVRRRGGLAGLLAGTAAFAALSLAIALVPAWIGIAAAVPGLVVGRRLVPDEPVPIRAAGNGPGETAARAAVPTVAAPAAGGPARPPRPPAPGAARAGDGGGGERVPGPERDFRARRAANGWRRRRDPRAPGPLLRAPRLPRVLRGDGRGGAAPRRGRRDAARTRDVPRRLLHDVA